MVDALIDGTGDGTGWWMVDSLLYGTSCYRLLVQVDSDRLIVVVVDSVTVTCCLCLEFIFQGGWTGDCSHLLVVSGEQRGL
jgi:hypothetical protein